MHTRNWLGSLTGVAGSIVGGLPELEQWLRIIVLTLTGITLYFTLRAQLRERIRNRVALNMKNRKDGKPQEPAIESDL